MTYRRLLAILAAIAPLAAACASDVNEPPPNDAASLEVVIDLGNLPAVATLVVEVTADDIDPPLIFNLTVDGLTAAGTLTLPTGTARTVTVHAFDAAGIETHRGMATLDVRPGDNPVLTILLASLTGDVPVEIGFDTIAIAITPAADTIPREGTLPLSATVVTVSGDTLDVPVTWATAMPAVATVDGTGLVTGVAPGVATIVATYGGKAAVAAVTVVDAVIAVTPISALVFEARIETSSAAGVTVDYWTDGEPTLRVASPPSTSHRILLARLLPNRTYDYSLVVGIEGTPLTGSFTTGALPSDLAAVDLTSTGRSTSPLILLELRPPTFQGFALVDARGRIVWFHRTSGASWGSTRRADGNFVFLDTVDGLTVVTPAGDVVATLPRANGEVIHHDVTATPQNTVYFMTRHPEVAEGATWTGEMVWEWNPDTDDLVARWNAFDFLSPATDVGPLSRNGDWLHTNSIQIGVSGNVLLSSPFLNQVIAVTPDFSAIAWRLGGVNGTILPDAAATFEFEHAATEIADGRVLVFDNRGAKDGPAPYSRALELSVDFSGGTATTAWVFRPPNDNYASIISSAWRMENGNTMVAFGTRDGYRESTGPIEVYEVAPDGLVVWHLVISGPDLMYRATPYDDIAGEAVVPG